MSSRDVSAINAFVAAAVCIDCYHNNTSDFVDQARVTNMSSRTYHRDDVLRTDILVRHNNPLPSTRAYPGPTTANMAAMTFYMSPRQRDVEDFHNVLPHSPLHPHPLTQTQFA